MQKIVDISSKIDSIKNDNIELFLKKKNKSLPTKYLYDEEGSKLFEKICDTEEYYLTRTEKKILDKNSIDILSTTKVKEVFELGSGSSKKTKILIREALKNNTNFTYSSFDISDEALQMSFKELYRISKNLNIRLIKGDFMRDLNNLTYHVNGNARLYLFLGSTIGNFDNDIAIKFLSKISEIMSKKDFFLLGVDNIKDEKIITSAYNDKLGITKKFNKNILNVINKKYNLNFKKNKFIHSAKYNSEKSQIEMYLESITNQEIKLPNDVSINIKSGEKILTEISRKFSEETLTMLFNKSNLKPVKCYSDEKKYFSLYLLKPKIYF